MKKLFLWMFFVALVMCNAWSVPVDSVKAKAYAQNFWTLRFAYRAPAQFRNVAAEAGYSNVYIFQNQNGPGFVILSGDDVAIPVLGYSDENTFDPSQMPQNLRSWIGHYENEIAAIRRSGISAAAEVSQQWENLEANRLPEEPGRAAVSPLLSTQWDQSSPYNGLCPSSCPTGCAATAMAQVMKYWNWPTTGTGSHSYTSNNNGYNYGTQSANFGNTTYQWSSMLDTYGYGASSTARNAVATLMYHCGVSIEMKYTPNESGAFISDYSEFGYASQPCVKTALKTYFKYSNSITTKVKQSYTDAQWINQLKTELNSSRPIVYSGYDDEENPTSGHAFVCDGYDASNNFHFNWGWSGYADGYFVVTSLTPAPGGIGGGNYDFSYGQHALFGIEPDNGGGGGEESAYNIQMYSDFTISPNPLVQGQSVSVSADVANVSDADFYGSFKLVLETANATQVQVIQEITVNQAFSSMTYGNLPMSGTVTASAGTYKLALYYKGSNESTWHYCGTNYGYDNPVTVTVTGSSTNSYNIQMYSDFTISPNPLVLGQSVSVSAAVANVGDNSFYGSFKLVLETANATQVQLIQEVTVSQSQSLPSMSYWESFPMSGTVTAAAGTYRLALYYKGNGESSWHYCGTDYGYNNPVTVTVRSNTGVTDLNASSCTVWPNPATDFVVITANAPVIENVELFTLAGKRVMEKNRMNSGEKLNLSTLPAGIYLLRLTTEEGVSCQKIIKQ